MNIDIDVSGIEACCEYLKQQPNRAKAAIKSATGRSLTAGRAAVSKGIRSEYSVKAGTIKGAIQMQKASSGLGGVLKVSGRPIDIMEFSPRTSRGMISVKIKKARKPLPHSFFVSANKAGIYHRVTRKRLPIEREFTLSVPQMGGNVHVAEIVQKRMAEVFSDRLEHAMIYGRGQGY